MTSYTEKPKEMPAEAKRALEEAQMRREVAKKAVKPVPAKEILGRDGPDPVRFGDWEKDGIISDF